MSFPYFDETKELNEAARREIGGSYIALEDGVTHYELGGAEGGVPVVLVHGFSTPLFVYDPTFEFLAASGFRVLRYDLFGRGFSDRPKLRYDMRLFVKQLRNLLDAFAMHRVDLVGLSMGGPITAAFIENHPHRVRKHVLIDPAGVKRLALPFLLEAVKIPVLGELLLSLFGNVCLIKGVASDFFDPKLVEAFQARYVTAMKYKGFKRAILSTLRSGMLDSFFDTYERLGALKKPTLLFWGRNDTTTPFADHKLILRALPHAEFHPVDDCSHIPHYEKPEIVNPILLEFLRK